MRVSIFILIISIACCSCGKLFENDTQNHYTISGRLFKGVSDEPFANQPLKLTGQYREVTELKFVDLGTATTDANGYFSIRYKSIKEVKNQTYDESTHITLELGDSRFFNPIKQMAWNTNIVRDFAQTDHCRVMVNFKTTNLSQDSFFIELPFPFDDENTTIVELPEVYEGFKKKAQVYSCKNGSVQKIIKLNIGSNWDSSPQQYFYVFGLSRKNMRTSMMVNAVDSVPDNHQNGKLYLRGFPKVDTVNISIP